MLTRKASTEEKNIALFFYFVWNPSSTVNKIFS